MLYPNFDELVNLRLRACSGNILFKQKVRSSMTGNYLSSFRGSGMEFNEVRRYVVGDDVRKIDWLTTARIGQPHIKLFKEERHLNAIISVDMNKYMRFGTRGTFKSIQAAKCCSILAWLINNHGDSVGGYLFGDIVSGDKFFRPKRSRYSVWQMIHSLAETKDFYDDEGTSITQSVDFLHRSAQPGSLVFIISDFLNIDAEFEKKLFYLSKHTKVILISVNDPSDMSIPSMGNASFTYDNKNIKLSTKNELGRENYQKQWLDNRNNLDKIVKRLGVHLINVLTNTDPQDQLFKGLDGKR